jgi:Na+(H+)/acetate symporter ActP
MNHTIIVEPVTFNKLDSILISLADNKNLALLGASIAPLLTGILIATDQLSSASAPWIYAFITQLGSLSIAYLILPNPYYINASE